MNLIFLRHGEATDNVKELISDKEIYWSILTEKGKESILESIEYLPSKIDKIYVSPFPRTIQTANFVFKKYPKTEVVIENRIHEISNGKYSGKKNNDDLDNTRINQINGDFFVRFGEYGENKFEIESRLCEFLNDVYKNNFKENTILIVSHGSIISYMKRILNLKTSHIKTGKLEEFINVDFAPLFNHIKLLKTIKNKKAKKVIQEIESLNSSDSLKRRLIKMFKKEFNNLEFTDEYFSNFISGLKTKSLKQIKSTEFDNGIILICFYNNFENFANKWINHYINIGIKNFVLVDNNSTDNSTEILKKYQEIVNISFWKIDEQYNCYKMCGWKQQIFEYYGIGNKYLTVDSDELFIYEGYKSKKLEDFINTKKINYIKSLMLDVYSSKRLFEGNIEDFNFVDKGTYKINLRAPYYQRFYGGPRSRIFGINPSLQKIPFITYTGKELFVNDHFYYPWDINAKATFCSYLLHYKFLPGDNEKYIAFAKDGRHWNNSREYKVYSDIILQSEKISFYDQNISIPVDEIDFDFKF